MRGKLTGPSVRALGLMHVLSGHRTLPVMAAVDPGVAAANGHVSWWPAYGLDASVEDVARCPALADGVILRSRDSGRILDAARSQEARRRFGTAWALLDGERRAEVDREARSRLGDIDWTRCVVIWVRA